MNPANAWIVLPALVGLGLLLALPAALLVAAWRPSWIERSADAVATRRTAVVVTGAGVLLAEFVLFAVCANAAPLKPVAGALLLAAAAHLVVGFAGGATAQGRALLRRDGGTSVLVLGWLARSGCFVVPALAPVLGAYLVASAFGAPVVAWWSSRPKSTIELSDGSTP